MNPQQPQHMPSLTSSSSTTASWSADQAANHETFFFSLVSASDVPVRFCVTSNMCARSLYLHSAREVAATDGVVPVGSTQAVRDYITYMQYSDLREQLAAELARSPAVHSPKGPPASAKPTASLLDDFPEDEEAEARDKGDINMAVLAAPALWDDPGLIHAEGARGFVVQPLDCDRAYVEHAAHLRHWFTAAELISLSADTAAGTRVAATATTTAAAAAATVGGVGARPLGHRRSPASTSTSSSPNAAAPASVHRPSAAAGASPAQPMPPLSFPHLSSGSPRDQGRLRQRRYSFMPSSSSSSSLSSSASSSRTSTPRLAPRGAQPARNAAGTDKAASSPSHGDRRQAGMCETLGYGKYVALDIPEDIFFLEHVLLPQRAPGVIASPAETPAMSPSGRDSIDVSLSAAQQCRLLELIAVADFMGTQPLVELCATYLAAWLMDHTEDELVMSFLGPAQPGGDESEAACILPNATGWQLAGATALTEPWIVPAVSSSRDAAVLAETAPVSAASPPPGAARGSSAKGGNTSPGTAPASTAKRESAAAAAAGLKQAGKQRAKAAGVGAAVPDAHRNDGASGSATSEVADSSAMTTTTTPAPLSLLSGDQRLALLRQMKRDNTIMMLVRGPFTVEKAERVCQWYYRFGFLGLPWLWGLLWLLFRHYEEESEHIRWYVARARQYSLAGAAVFVAVSLVLLWALPPSSPLWVVAPFQDTFQWGFFAANASDSGSNNVDGSSSGSSSFA